MLTGKTKLIVMLIGPEDPLVREWKDIIAGMGDIVLGHHEYRYPSPGEMIALLDEHQPDALVINLADHNQVRRSVVRLGMDRPQLPIIALHVVCEPGLLLDLMQLGIRELWFPPLNPEQIHNAVNRLLQQKKATTASQTSLGELIAFLPARGGCGATTIALNAAAALQRIEESVLLADFDFHNSVLAFWLKLAPKHGFQEALERAHWLDLTLWKGMVQNLRGLDILTAPQAALPMVFSGPETAAVLDFARRHYRYLLVDLPDAIYSSCWEVLDSARYTMLVVTPEMASLYLARRKISQLVNHGIPRDNIRVLLNRTTQFDLQATEVEKFLSLPVMAAFSNQYRTVTAAFGDGRYVSQHSNLGEQFAHFASLLAGKSSVRESKPVVQRLRRIFSPA